jgi:hypothetical protein
VDEPSQLAPLHMKALMYQNLGVLMYELALSSDNSNDQRTDVSVLRMEQAFKYLTKSVALFESHPHFRLATSSGEENPGKQHLHPSADAASLAVLDASTLMEVSHSLQMLAGAACSLQRYQRGVRLWDRAIRHATDSLLHGAEDGVRHDNLLLALYNGAVCHHAAADRSRGTGELAAAASLVASAGTYCDEAVSHLEKSHRKENENNKLEQDDAPLLRAARDLRGFIQATAAEVEASVQESRRDRDRNRGREQGNADAPQQGGAGYYVKTGRGFIPAPAAAAVSATTTTMTTTSTAGSKNLLHSSASASSAGPQASEPDLSGGVGGVGLDEQEGEGEEEVWVECELDEECEYFDVYDPEEGHEAAGGGESAATRPAATRPAATRPAATRPAAATTTTTTTTPHRTVTVD